LFYLIKNFLKSKNHYIGITISQQTNSIETYTVSNTMNNQTQYYDI